MAFLASHLVNVTWDGLNDLYRTGRIDQDTWEACNAVHVYMAHEYGPPFHNPRVVQMIVELADELDRIGRTSTPIAIQRNIEAARAALTEEISHAV